MRSVLITGVQGVGKSTVSRLAAEVLHMQSWDYADLMLQVAPRLADKDAIGGLTWEQRRRIYDDVEVLLATLFAPGDGRDECVFLENHLSILDAIGFRTFPHDDLPRYNPVALVVIESTPEEIVERRRVDRRRNRHIGATKEVEEQQEINWREAAAIRQRFGIALRQLDNSDVKKAAKELVSWLTTVMS